MEVLWGALTAAIGVLFYVWGRSRSDFVVYRLMVARSRLLWRDRVHVFYQVIGVLLIGVGMLLAVLG